MSKDARPPSPSIMSDPASGSIHERTFSTISSNPSHEPYPDEGEMNRVDHSRNASPAVTPMQTPLNTYERADPLATPLETRERSDPLGTVPYSTIPKAVSGRESSLCHRISVSDGGSGNDHASGSGSGVGVSDKEKPPSTWNEVRQSLARTAGRESQFVEQVSVVKYRQDGREGIWDGGVTFSKSQATSQIKIVEYVR
ncbi:uncharacterized protein I303_100993 [Kwoniella dejecticola CBS 10117]|uniref:Uncharacterized protein n=1 Tax=Kwoniella dejecticola CBS 10117 TaxID=1296121 RepID=A0AAJ8KHL8_9TREE